jgi:two-component system sensor histidine kinase DctS
MNFHADTNDDLFEVLRAAVDCVDEGVLITEATSDASDSEIVFVNRVFEEMSGYKAHEVLGHSPRKFAGPRTERAVLDRLSSQLAPAAQKGDKRTFSGDTYAYRKDGSAVHVRLKIYPVVAEGDRVRHYVTLARVAHAAGELEERFRSWTDAQNADANEREEQAKRLNDQLAHIARLNTLGDLAGRLAHELNQPLTAISNYAQGCANRLTAQQIGGQELLSVLESIRDAAFRAGVIVDRLREFARRKGPRQVQVDLEAAIRHLLDLIEPEVRQSGVRVELEIPRDLPRVYADPLQIEQAIVNLARNALESMADTPPQDRRLTIRAECKTAGEVEVAVCDRGRGLERETAERLFEPFFSTKPFGLGMGLPVSRSIFQGHGGRLWIDCGFEGGACFRFTLPTIQGAISNGDGN